MAVRLGLLRASTDVGGARRTSTVGALRVLHGRLALLVRSTILSSRSTSRGGSLPAAVLIRVTHLAASVLRNVWNDLHAARDDALRTTVANGVGRSSGATEAFSQLLNKRAADVVGGDVNSVRDTEDDEGAFSREGQARLGGVEARTRCLLNLADSNTALADDGTDEDVGNEKAERVGLGLGSRRLLKGLLVKGADDEAESLCIVSMIAMLYDARVSTYLGDGIDEAAHGENTLNSAPGVLADGALGTSHATDLADIFATLADDSGSFSTGDDGADVEPTGLVALVVLRSLRCSLGVLSRAGGLNGLGLEDLVGSSSAVGRDGCIWDDGVTMLVGGLGAS